MATFHRSVEASGSAAVEQLLREIVPNVRYRAERADIMHRASVDGDERFSLARLEVGAQFWARNEPVDAITIVAPLHGTLEWSAADELGGSTPWMHTPGTPPVARFGPVIVVSAILPIEPLLAFGRAAYGDDEFELRFAGPRPVSRRVESYIATMLRQLQSLASSPAFESPLVRVAIYRQLAGVLFEAFRLDGDRRRRALSAESRRGRYRVAAQFIEDHASLPITAADIAQAAEVSVDQLDDIFRGFSPVGADVERQLERTRLAAAHQDLVRGHRAAGASVREIAHRWGFARVGGFAQRYRREYGVTAESVLG